MNVSNLRNRLLVQLTGFGLSGISSAIVNLSATVSLHEVAGLTVRAAYLGGLLLAMGTNFFICRHLIFNSRKRIYFQLVAFVGSSLFFRGLEYTAFLFLETVFPYIAAIVLIQGVSFLLKFFYYRRFVFNAKVSS